jgi:mono/diheme cytochrome c family protein
VRRPPATPTIILAVALAGAAAGFTRGGGGSEAPSPPVPAIATPEATPEAATRPSGPRELFASTCGTCHTLRAARVRGMVGPDLDAVRPSAARVRRAIRNGSLDGVMQPGLLSGDDARGVAAYVARAARG